MDLPCSWYCTFLRGCHPVHDVSIGNRRIRSPQFLARWFATSNVRGSCRTKKAATRKINALLENAYELHPKGISGQEGPATTELTMVNFVLKGERFEDCAGVFWTYKRLLSGALFDEEGVWIASRLIIIQSVQAVFVVFLSYSEFLGRGYSR